MGYYLLFQYKEEHFMIKAIHGNIKNHDIYLIVISLVASVAMLFIPTGFSENQKDLTSMRTRATILSVDNSLIKEIGPVIEGTQQLTIKIEKGPFTDEVLETVNILIGKKNLIRCLFQETTPLLFLI